MHNAGGPAQLFTTGKITSAREVGMQYVTAVPAQGAEPTKLPFQSVIYLLTGKKPTQNPDNSSK